jgi:hypothetical protein
MEGRKELISKIQDALDESKFWFKLEEKVGDINLNVLHILSIYVEEIIADNIEDIL